MSLGIEAAVVVVGEVEVVVKRTVDSESPSLAVVVKPIGSEEASDSDIFLMGFLGLLGRWWFVILLASYCWFCSLRPYYGQMINEMMSFFEYCVNHVVDSIQQSFNAKYGRTDHGKLATSKSGIFEKLNWIFFFFFWVI